MNTNDYEERGDQSNENDSNREDDNEMIQQGVSTSTSTSSCSSEEQGHFLNMKINRRDWDGVVQLLVKYQHVAREEERKQVKKQEAEKKENIVLMKNENGLNVLHLALFRRAPTKVVLELVKIGGSEAILEKDGDGKNALHIACCNEAPVEVISKLIEIGGGIALVLEKDGGGNFDNSLHIACENGAPVDVILKLIDFGGSELVFDQNVYGCTPFHLCFTFGHNAPMEVISKFIDIGGRELVVKKTFYGHTSLHCACGSFAPVEVISKLIDVGGREFVLEKNENREYGEGHNCLHYACEKMYEENVPVEVVSKLIEVGGSALVFDKNARGLTCLHTACENNLPIEIISKLIDAGGRELVAEKDGQGKNCLRFVCDNNPSVEVISKLVEVGGEDAVLEGFQYGRNLLHHICDFFDFDELNFNDEFLDLLIQSSDKVVLYQKDGRGRSPLQVLLSRYDYAYVDEDEDELRFGEAEIENAMTLTSKYLQLQIGGEFALGGIFVPLSDEEVRDKIHRKWYDNVLPVLERVMALPEHRHEPVIQAAIINESPPHILKDIISRFTESLNTLDSLDRNPIDIAIEYRHSWDYGMRELVEAFAATQQPATVLAVAARCGLPWELGMNKVLEEYEGHTEQKDGETALFPFMLAAVDMEGKNNIDLASVFHLIRKSPLQVRQYDRCDREAPSRKRKAI